MKIPLSSLTASVAAVFLLAAQTALALPIIHDPWVRPSPPGHPVTAAFMNIENRGDKDDALISATAHIAKVVELHATVEEEGVFKMKKQESIPLPAGKTIQLKPRGLHIMLIDLISSPKAGEKVRMILKFESGAIVDMEVPVVEKMMMESDKDESHDHHHGMHHGH